MVLRVMSPNPNNVFPILLYYIGEHIIIRAPHKREHIEWKLSQIQCVIWSKKGTHREHIVLHVF